MRRYRRPQKISECLPLSSQHGEGPFVYQLVASDGARKPGDIWRCIWHHVRMVLCPRLQQVKVIAVGWTENAYAQPMGLYHIIYISYQSYHISYHITVYQVLFPMLLSKETPCKRHQGVRHKKLGRCWKWNRQECRISIVDPSGKLPQKTTGKITMLLMGKLTITGVFSIDLLMFTRPGHFQMT